MYEVPGQVPYAPGFGNLWDVAKLWPIEKTRRRIGESSVLGLGSTSRKPAGSERGPEIRWRWGDEANELREPSEIPPYHDLDLKGKMQTFGVPCMKAFVIL
jgi:hypothetical protein